jgi:Mce-associated membrane protein
VDVAEDAAPQRRPRPYRTPDEPQPAVEAPADESSAPPPGRRNRSFALAVAALVACLGLFVAGLVVHLTAGPSTDARTAQLRDQVLLDARQDIVVLNTLDYRAVDQGLERWRAASTGTLHDSLAHVSAATRQHIVSQRKIATARVMDAAVVSLDPNAGSATVIAAVQLRVLSANGKTTIKRERLRAETARVGGAWKVSSLEQVGVTLG